MAENGSKLFLKWSQIVLKNRLVFFIAILLITGFFVQKIKSQLRVDNSTEAFLARGSKAKVILDKLRSEFGQDRFFLFLVEGDVFSMPYLNNLKKLQDELQEINFEFKPLVKRNENGQKTQNELKPSLPKEENDGFEDFGSEEDEGWGDEEGGSIFDEITSIINMRKTTGASGSLVVGELLDPFPTKSDLPRLKKEILSDKNILGNLIGAKGQHSVILLRTMLMEEEDSHKIFFKLLEFAKKHSKPGFKLLIGGMPAFEATMNTTVLGDLRKLVLSALGFMVFLLFFIFRHPLAVIGPILVVGQSAIWTLGSMAIMGYPMTMITNIIPSFLFCVGLGDSIHIISIYRDRIAEGMDSFEALNYSISHSGMPILFTSLTTMVGLLSLNAASLDSIGEMGLAAGFGVLVALALSITLLPILLSFNKTSVMGLKKGGKKDFIDSFLNFCNNLSQQSLPKRKYFIFCFTIFLSAIALYLTFQLKVFHNPVTWLNDSNQTKQAFLSIDENVGGAAGANILIEPKGEKGIKNLALLKGMEALENDLVDYKEPYSDKPLITNFSSLVNIVKESNKALNGGTEEQYKLPDSDRGIADTLFLFENAGQQHLRRLATGDLSKTQMTLRLRWRDATSYLPFSIYLEKKIEEHLGPYAHSSPTGTIYNLVSTISNLIGDLLKSFSLAFLLITIMMILVLRSFKLGLIAMIPNLVPILFILAFMKLADIPIDLSNLLIASIAIGIAVDDTIHFLYHFRESHKTHGDTELALQHVFSHSGRALVTTSIILFFGFLVYLNSSVANISRFGVLVSLTIFFALFIDLIVCPAILRIVYKRSSNEASTS